MVLLNWSSSFSVDNEQLDYQHEQLVWMANELHDAIALTNGETPKVILDVLFDRLIDYAKFHFADEERIMKAENYPDYEHHKLEHEKFAKRIIELHSLFTKNKLNTNQDVVPLLKDWITNHICGEDKKAFKK